MDNTSKIIFIILAIVYIISPVDLCPGPIDDIIVFLVSLAQARK